MTRLLDRFRDVEVAKKEGYRQPWHNDGLMMGEQWFKPELLSESVCDLERPAFLQYLMIDGHRTLIGVGYACDGKQRAARRATGPRPTGTAMAPSSAASAAASSTT